MKKIVLATLALLTSAGCTSTAFYGPSGRFSDAEKIEIERAGAEWNRATKGIAQVEIVWEDGVAFHTRRIVRVTPERLRLEHPGKDGYTTWNWSLATNATPELVIELAPENGHLYERALHELGHGLGLKHSDEGSVMYHTLVGQATCVTRADLAQFCGVYGCDVAEMAPCDAP